MDKPMKLHHVGITVNPGTAALEKLIRMDALFGAELGEKFHIEKWKCDCFPCGMVEFIVLHEGSPLLNYHVGHQRWSGNFAPFVLHHIALEVEDYDGTIEKLEKVCRVIGKDEIGYTMKRIAFLHPEYFGILVEVVEA